MARAVNLQRAVSCLAHHTHPVCKQSLRRAYLSPKSPPCLSVPPHPLLHLSATTIHQCTLSSCLMLPRLYQQRHRFALAATTAYPLLSCIKSQTHHSLCLAADWLGLCGAAQQRHLNPPASTCTTPARTPCAPVKAAATLSLQHCRTVACSHCCALLPRLLAGSPSRPSTSGPTTLGAPDFKSCSL